MLKKMDKNEVITILEDWNFWKKDLDTGIRRPLYISKLQKFTATNQISVITGARRSGKSFIMRQFAKDLITQGVDGRNILIINFEDPRFTELNAKALQDIYEIYLEFLAPKGISYIFLDEIQEVEDWEKWVRTMHELKKANIIISGSNAKLLSRELSTLLTGRHIDLEVFPLSFIEYLAFNDISINDKLDFINKKIEIKGMLRRYIEFGAFPEVVLKGEKKEILLRYFEDILNKDLIKRYKIRKSEKLNSLAKFYLSNISSPITYSSIENYLNISADTIEKYSGYFENAFMLFFLKRHSFKVREQDKSPKKLYSIDTGLANAVGFRFTENLGRCAENIVFLELKRQQSINPNLEIFYWKDNLNREVDFLIKEGLGINGIIQVCWDPNKPETKKRELRILLKAMDEFGIKKGLVVTEDYNTKEDIDGKVIEFIGLSEWLLGNLVK